MTRRAALRASDADRDQVAERLRRAAAEGRLFPDELEERLGATFSARTYGELDALVADLPASPAAPARQDARPSRLRSAVAIGFGVPLALMVLVAAVAAVAGHAHPGHPWAGGVHGGGALVWLVIIALAWRWFARRHHGAD